MMSILLLLPLVPVLLAFVKRRYDTTPMHYLVLICLLDFMRGLSERFAPLTENYRYTPLNIIDLLQIVAIAQLYKTQMTQSRKITLNILLAAFLSSILTWFCTAGWERHGPVLDSLLDALTIGIILGGLRPLLRDGMLYIFRSPLVYIGAGLLFYSVLTLLVEWAMVSCHTPYPDPEHRLFLSIAAIVKYALFTRAVFACAATSETEA